MSSSGRTLRKRKDGRAIVEKAQTKEKILADKIVYEEELI